MELFQKISTIVALITLMLVVVRLFLIHKIYKADHERTKKQSTIEYINSIRQYYKPLEVKLTRKFGKTAVINLADIDDDIKEDIRELLSVIENLSTGVNSEVYDAEIINRMSGSYFINLYKRLQPYIDHARIRDNNPLYFQEFEAMINCFKEMRNTKNTQGDIKYS